MTKLQIRNKLRKASAIVFSSRVQHSAMKAASVGLIGVVGIAAGSPSQAAVVNGDFSTGDFTGWQTTGLTSAANGQATLNSGGTVSYTDLESFLGLNPGTIDTIAPIPATFGSAIKQTITVNAGDTLNFDWAFQAGDEFPYNDFSFFSVASNIGLLADVFGVGDYGLASARQSYTFSTAGTYTIGFGVANALDNDSNYTSYLGVDNVAVESVPEPLTIMGSLTAGAFGVALRRRQKQQQKASVKA